MIDYFYKDNFKLNNMVENLVLFIFDDIKYFKKSDLQIIHQRLNISPQTYQFFMKVLEDEMKKLNIDENYVTLILEKVQSY